jgi:signal transduction histidine kinase
MNLTDALSLATAIVFTLLTVASVREYLRRPSEAARWLVATFATLAFVTVVGQFLPKDPKDVPYALNLLDLALIVAFPYLLYRFASSFGAGRRWLDRTATWLTVVTIVSMLLAGEPPEPGAPLPTRYAIFVVVILVQWLVLLSVVTVTLWRGGRGQPPVAARRMRLLAWASALLAVALTIAAASAGNEPNEAMQVASSVLAMLSGLLFYAGYVPPTVLRVLWRSPSLNQLREATIALMATSEVDELQVRYLPQLAALVGAEGVAIVDHVGKVLGVYGVTTEAAAAAAAADGATADDADGVHVEHVASGFGQILVWTGRFTPFFGTEELSILQSTGVVLDLALDRFRALEQQREIAERLRLVNELKNEFVAVVAHDLRSPMSVISGFARTIDNQWDFMPEEQKREILRIIAGNTESLATLVEDVLQVARIESGELTYHMRPFDMGALAGRVVRDMSSIDERPFKLDIEDGVPPALGDEDRQWQVLTNLVTNAMKFSPNSDPVEVRVCRRGPRLEVSVVDHGIGIRPEDQGRVFDKFARIEPNDPSTRVKGSGLGLFITRTIVEAHGGELRVRSKPGAGSTFTYTVPAATEASP